METLTRGEKTSKQKATLTLAKYYDYLHNTSFNISKLKTSINRVTFEKPTTGIQLYIMVVIFLSNLENYVLCVALVFLISIHHHKYDNMRCFMCIA